MKGIVFRKWSPLGRYPDFIRWARGNENIRQRKTSPYRGINKR